MEIQVKISIFVLLRIEYLHAALKTIDAIVHKGPVPFLVENQTALQAFIKFLTQILFV